MKTLLAETTDRSDRSFDVFHCAIDFTEIYPLFLRVYADHVDLGYRYPTSAWAPYDNQVVYAQTQGRVLGFIAFSLQTALGHRADSAHNLACIDLVWVDPDYTNQGIFTAMLINMENHLRTQGIEYLQAVVHHQQQALIDHLGKQGFFTKFYTFRKRIIDV
jgi:ribosomal protein S18 acetylase RimI-like enzyme